MSSSVLESLPVGRITAQAKRTASTLTPARAVMAVLTGVLFALGWLAAKSWFVLVWVFTAVQVGWQDAQRARLAGEARGPAR
jgi:hypothetical protein